ncbi:pyruvate kinase alpha/beta domain-containing protein [Chloroflexota bacterium]
MEEKIHYFEELKRENTDQTFKIALQRGPELGIRTFVVASTSGWTGVQAMKAFEGMNLIVVSHCYGSRQPNEWFFEDENLQLLKDKGVSIITAAHAFGGITRAMNQMKISGAPTTYVIGDIVANTLRMFGQGMKVACEIACMAADAGLVRCDEDIISMGGSGRVGGADVAVVLTPANSHRLFETKIKEILCKPRNIQ